MKLLNCELCGDIFSPIRENDKPKWCTCGRYAIWWKNSMTGDIRVTDSEGQGMFLGTTTAFEPVRPIQCWIIGITNLFLSLDFVLTKDKTRQLIDAHGDNYLFKKQDSLIIKFRPGHTNDSKWAALPDSPYTQ